MSQIYTDIPLERPETPLLDTIDRPEQLRDLSPDQLQQLVDEVRHFMIYSVGQSGGHFGAGLGVVELTVSLHYVFNTPDDRLVWDVGHQAYPHKILTERREEMLSIRKTDGLAAFPTRFESEYDTFGVGHSSTSIGAALGMAMASKQTGENKKTVAIIGDGALTAGMAFEALNHTGHTDQDILVILNDNDMSISENVGALNKYLSRILASKTYLAMREGSRKVLSVIPKMWELARKTEEHVKGMVMPGTLFEEFGFNYIGPVDGHDVDRLVTTLENISEMKGPQFLHIVTHKGKGFEPAEQDQIKYHALPGGHGKAKSTTKKLPTFSNVFGKWLCEEASKDERLIGITPAMREGSDLIEFSQTYPERYVDVAIAEQHAVTLAAGMACEGAKPVVAIYSTFLQRAYDQLIHDVALQNLDVTFAIDRGGLVGADGPTHHGAFDLSYLRCVPNLIVMTPSDETECRNMLHTAYHFEGPTAVRYPRGSGIGASIDEDLTPMTVGKGRIVRSSSVRTSDHSDNDRATNLATISTNSVAILCFGPILHNAIQAAEKLDSTLVDMRFVKPLDTELISELSKTHKFFVTVEDNAIRGGAGSAVAEFISNNKLNSYVLNLGLPDQFVEHGSVDDLYQEIGLDPAGLLQQINDFIK